MKSWGLEIVRTGAVEFYGAAYEEMRAKYGELEKQRRLVEFGKAQIEVLAAAADQDVAEGKRNAKREQETAEYLAQLAQEKELSESHSKYEEAGTEIEKLEQKIESMRQEISDTTLKRSGIDSQIKILTEQINSIGSSTEHFKGRAGQIEESLKEHEAELIKLGVSKAEIDKKIEELAGSGR